ncbi:BNR repeat domain protein [Labilithrix luteola]|uniref:BNR repeat domain protein n=1 Tax=Labilithrix luteola TaxID=1391654 RepID=A0A0K1PKD2_9BACT|nr:hypothetical protein [Labilithrix luteola]AKU93977.1 BNR repeat domain protein [Labilithrix luteola]
MRRLALLCLAGITTFAAFGCEGLFGVDFDGLGPTKAVFETEAGVDAAGPDSPDSPSCSTEEKSCSGTCVHLDAIATGCGADSCSPCPTAENGIPRCESRQCTTACDVGYRRCRSGCCASPEKPAAAGTTHTCATSNSGALYCWGANDHGQLGIRSTDNRLTPAFVNLEGGTRELALGIDFTLAAMTSGAVHAWGANTLGAFGNGTDGANDYRDTPFPIQALSDIAYVAANAWHGCAISRSGFASCWGYNASGVVGNGSAAPEILFPAAVVQPEAFVSLSTNTSHACAVGVSGALYCWGSNAYGQLGLENLTKVAVPTLVPNLVSAADLAAVACGNEHTCVLTRTGGVRCWGSNRLGQLGIGNTEAREHAVDTLAPSSASRQIVAGDDYTCVVSSSGAVQCWGLVYGTVSPLGAPPDGVLRPNNVNLGPAAFLAAGAHHVCARMLDNHLRCWGANSAGQIGDGTRTDRADPVDVPFPN